MTNFSALDEILNARTLATSPARELGGTPAASDFQPLFAAAALGSSHSDRPTAEGHDAPQIELVQADGRIQQIIVTCRCGERTVLDCAY